MDETTSVLDIFSLCWNAIETESKQLNCKFDGKSEANDSRDENFQKTKVRLAFLYKYGSFNIKLVAKCISNFLAECPAENIFPVENLKVCSFSNGPGLDIVGLLCALYKPEKTWKCYPELKSVNLHNSWLNMYNLVVREAYEKISFKSFIECHEVDDIPHTLPTENIQLIQNNICDKISPEAEKFISESNILLMVNIFVSSKPAADGSFTNTLEKIFSLLKPGTLIFFVGTKQNKKKISEDVCLKNIAKCIFGPKAVTLENLPPNIIIKNLTVNAKPQYSGSAYFIVWQRREIDITPNIIETKEQKALKSIKNTKNDEDELSNVTDAGSETAFITSNKQSEPVFDTLKNGLFSNDSDINGEFSEKESQNSFQNSHAHSSNSITSIVNGLESILDNVENSNTGKMNFNECLQLGIHHLTSKSGSNNLESKKLASNEVQIKSETTKEVYPLKKATKKNRTKKNKSLKKYISSDNINSISNAETSFTNDDSYQKISTVFPPVIQNDVHKADENTPNKNRNNIVQANISTVNQSYEDTCKFPRNVMDTQNFNDRNSNDFQKIIERCDMLVTSLEEMTADIKINMNPKHNHQMFKCCGVSEASRKFSVSHCSGVCNSVLCAVCKLPVQSNCCRNTCKCNTKNICMNSLPCRNYIKEQGCCKRYKNFSRPYIVIPLENSI